MKVAVASQGETLTAPADPRFGRCAFFVVVDAESGDTTAVPNPGAEAGGGAGIMAAQAVANSGADAVIAGNYGPSAAQALLAGGLAAYVGKGGTVADEVEALKAEALETIGGPTVDSHHGLRDKGQD